MSFKKTPLRYLKLSQGFTNIAAVISLALLLLPAVKLLATPIVAPKPQSTVQKVAGIPVDYCEITKSGVYLSVSPSGCTLHSDIEIKDNFTTLDGGGKSIDGDGTYGIHITGSNVTVKNTTLTNTPTAIYSDKAENTIIINNTISDSQNGILFSDSTSGEIKDNTITGVSAFGIELKSNSTANNISGNKINGNVNGIALYGQSSAEKISGNTITGSSYHGLQIIDDAKVNNLSQFPLPAGNKFSSNLNGNCFGNGFDTEETQKKIKCPDDAPSESTTPSKTQPNPGSASTMPSESPSPTQNAYPGPGYCGKNSPINADVDPKWLADPSNPSAGITCNFGDTTGYKNDSNADAYCRQHIDTVHGFFYPCPAANSGNNGGGGGSNGGQGNGGLNPIIICKDHNGVDGSKFPNGYVAPLCLPQGTAPSDSNYTQGIYTTANATAGKYKDGKYYDMYLCQGGAHDFIPFTDTPVCSKPPWTPDTSTGAPTCPKSGDDPDKKIWNGTACDYPPDACAQTGPHGHTNLCVPYAQKGSYGAPDTDYPNAADKKCTEYENALGYTGNFACVLAPTGGSSPAPSPSTSPSAGGSSSPGAPSPSAKTGTETEYGHCYHGDQDCAPQYKCNSNPGTATSYCVYRNPSEPTAYCATANNLHCVQANADGSIPADCDQTGLHMGDNYSCQRAKIGTFCCTGAPSTGSTSTGTQSSVASEGIPVSLTSCTNNSQCVQLKSGNACVFTNSQLAGVCMKF